MAHKRLYVKHVVPRNLFNKCAVLGIQEYDMINKSILRKSDLNLPRYLLYVELIVSPTQTCMNLCDYDKKKNALEHSEISRAWRKGNTNINSTHQSVRVQL